MLQMIKPFTISSIIIACTYVLPIECMYFFYDAHPTTPNFAEYVEAGMWGSGIDHSKYVEPCEDLTEENTILPYFQKRKTPPYATMKETIRLYNERNRVLKIAVKSPNNMLFRNYWRRNLVAAVLIGGDINIVQDTDPTIFGNFVLYNDISVVKILLEHGANVHQEWHTIPPIYNAHSVDMAKLLIKYKAIEHNKEKTQALLVNAMGNDYKLGLIDLYKRNGCDPLARDQHGYSALMSLVDKTSQPHYIDKAIALLAGLSCAKQRELLAMATPWGTNVFDIIRKERFFIIKYGSEALSMTKINQLENFLARIKKNWEADCDNSLVQEVAQQDEITSSNDTESITTSSGDESDDS